MTGETSLTWKIVRMFSVPHYLKNMGIEDYVTELGRCNKNIVELEEKLDTIKSEKKKILRDFFKTYEENKGSDSKDRYLVPKYRDLLKLKNLVLYRLEQEEWVFLNMLEYMQEKRFPIMSENQFIDFLQGTMFNENPTEEGPALWRVSLNISEGTGKITTINPVFSSKVDIPFRIDPSEKILGNFTNTPTDLKNEEAWKDFVENIKLNKKLQE